MNTIKERQLAYLSALKESNSTSLSLSSPVKLVSLTLYLTSQKIKIKNVSNESF